MTSLHRLSVVLGHTTVAPQMPDQQKYTAKLHSAKVLIIGGSSGIGYGVAEASLEHGASVIISSSSEARLSSAVQRLQSAYPSRAAAVRGYACDLGDTSTIDANVTKLFEVVGTVDHIVFTAGDALATLPLRDVTAEKFQKVGVVRFVGPMIVAKHALNRLAPGPKSSFTITTGSSAEKPGPGWSVPVSYGGGLISMARGLALDMKPIRVNIISPGAVDTELWNMSEETKQKLFATMGPRLPTGRVGRVEDVAEAYIYAMKDENLTGSLISTNGGGLLL
jgi:NAD(P)-dependent dehydrogenase (short-subunit alcohol dehydrogenase family)